MTDMPTMRKPDECDAIAPSIIFDNDAQRYICRCTVCARCRHHTGNNGQGHYWARCKVTGRQEDYHFCCPNDCELYPAPITGQEDPEE